MISFSRTICQNEVTIANYSTYACSYILKQKDSNLLYTFDWGRQGLVTKLIELTFRKLLAQSTLCVYVHYYLQMI